MSKHDICLESLIQAFLCPGLQRSQHFLACGACTGCGVLPSRPSFNLSGLLVFTPHPRINSLLCSDLSLRICNRTLQERASGLQLGHSPLACHLQPCATTEGGMVVPDSLTIGPLRPSSRLERGVLDSESTLVRLGSFPGSEGWPSKLRE